MFDKVKIAIVGLGYVGLPLARLIATKYPTIGFDINIERINNLNRGVDETREVEYEQLNLVLKKKDDLSNGLYLTSNHSNIKDAKIYIVTVPTPLDKFNSPDLEPLIKATKLISYMLKMDDIVIFESTVFPGCTEEVCVPILEKYSRLKFNKDFYVGYSPERINPGDKINTLEKIVKITSGSTPEIADRIDSIYRSVISAGTYKAPSIKVAEAAKVIENAQRDVNISFVNEVALICNSLGIDTLEVLDAARTKFNFIDFKPGLVGGHCISVDPYYLAHKAVQFGYYPNVILSGRKVNEEIPIFIANKVIKMMINKGINVSKAKVLILGFAFKENCPDIRNSKVVKIYNELLSFNMVVDIYDPLVSSSVVWEEYKINVLSDIFGRDSESNKNDKENFYDAIIIATGHDNFKLLNLKKLISSQGVVFDAKGIIDKRMVDCRL